MNPQRWEEVGRLYQAALEQEPQARGAFLDTACGEDDALRREVASLLAYADHEQNYLDGPALAMAAHELATAELPDTQRQPPPVQLGSYQVIAPLGSGGMGEVFLARDQKLGRNVAIKRLAARLTTDGEHLRRFTQEARAVSALNHPNILTIHEIGEHENTHYLVTEYVEGETLRQRLANAPGHKLGLFTALDLAQQVAAALAAAHAAGITHRDIKPENVMIRRDGLVKVLDFGLAKLRKDGGRGRSDELEKRNSVHPSSLSSHLSTAPGVVMGTPRYMSPEQASGEAVDSRTDLFSLGVMLYEMVAGHPPFTGATTGQMIAAILRDAPQPVRETLPDAPAALEQILERALCKSRDERYQTAQEFAAELKTLQRTLETEVAKSNGATATVAFKAIETDEHPKAHTTKRHGFGLSARRWLLTGGALIVLAGLGWWGWRAAKVRQARAALPRLEQLAKDEQFFEAYDLAQTIKPWLPNDATLTRWMPLIADHITITSQPPGARVYLQRFVPEQANEQAGAPREFIGVTPINQQTIARGGYILTLEKEGYDRFERTVTGLAVHIQGWAAPTLPQKIEVSLVESTQAHSRMVFVPGGEYRLASYDRPTSQAVQLDDFFMDKYEVTNKEYKEFVEAGGYLKREYWRQSFMQGVNWEEVVRQFKDRTGLPGPRTWTNQDFPAGQAEHPVADISWYEAAAYAAFRGKELPTIYQWEKAARSVMERGIAGYFLMPWGPYTGANAQRANFNGQATMPVNSLAFGQSMFGCYHMAGNVAEWLRNTSAENAGSFAVTGGSYEDPPYLFGRYGPYPGTFTASKLGFRCALAKAPVKGDQGSQALFATKDIPTYRPVDEATFRSWENIHRYDQSPLDAQVIEVKEMPDWRREKVTFNSGGERVIAYLWLPKNYPPPWQLIEFLPGDNVYQGWNAVSERVEGSLGGHIKAGRAVLAVVLAGFPERRPPDFTVPPPNTADYRDFVVQQSVDGRRALDYALSRPDLDAARVALYMISSGPGRKVLLSAVEPRFRTVVIIGTGIFPSYTLVYPEINPVNLFPRIRQPKLVMIGRYDENMAIKTETEPCLKLLPEPKRVIWFEGGHIPTPEIAVPPVNAWLDETLGPVKNM